MIRKRSIICIIPLLLLVFLPGPGFGENSDHKSGQTVDSPATIEQERSEKALLSLLTLETSIKSRIKSREEQLTTVDSDNEKKRIKDEIEELGKHFSKATADFERLATGVEHAVFAEKRKDTFSWQDELTSLLKPAIREMKILTINAREKTSLQTDIAHYEELLPIAEDALKNLQDQIVGTDNPELKKQLQSLLPEWQNINAQLQSSLDVLHLKLKDIELNDKPFIDDIQKSTSHFFKNRGLYLGLALTVFLLTLFCFSIARKLLQKHISAFHHENRPFFVRLFDHLFRLFGLIVALLTLFIVFYIVEDWTLLSLLVILLIAVIWSLRVMLPKFLDQGGLLLNVGSVREGERLMLHGVPWRIKKINMFTILENPDLKIQLRLPIEKLVGLCSRQYTADETWFPCRKNDWVVLSDKSFGKVITLSHEFVTLLERGGSRKTYQTPDFLGLAPRNLSTNFRVKEVFGVSYDLQQQVTDQLTEVLLSSIQQQFALQGDEDQLLDLQVRFNQAGASSLDLVVIADFKGTAAPLYNRMRRNIQYYCMKACTDNNWEIPFPQLTIHKTN